jgi:hypothetical protein
LCDESQTGSGVASVVTHAYEGGDDASTDDASMTAPVPESTAASSPLASSVMMLVPPPSTVASSPTIEVPPASSEPLFNPPLLLPPELPELAELPELLPLDTLASGAPPLLLVLLPVELSKPGPVAEESPVAHAEATSAMAATSVARDLGPFLALDAAEFFIVATLV